ncbi:hypothetical protein RS584_15505 [Enterobacter sp. DTU_2021_1002640_1_SI_PRY_ASU_LCPMC_013]|uniref:hypothetical protein n=1 Tax=Enterobacter sp. DTU_2021_1002640_1_SI_PRY_ASU_LCPMC_013 TaxID=3077940 RepID=UPI0028F0717E|nr:hypothetical protein [Enterobacter sp. DTU_2021_1002640_1_SI_PRY_ASU_LCPMC_013]WNU99106.1 hypothetical protein RS584_15505 [Enterobacter sp. DTU_2021_1002640_1_SI_PRY_ASU_LCPMC_013]
MIISLDKFLLDKKIVFLGESIHGVDRFNTFRLFVARKHFKEMSILVFEADSSGMSFSHNLHENAIERMANFPKVMRNREIQDILAWSIKNDIPSLGIDCIPRRRLHDFPEQWRQYRQQEVLLYEKYKLGSLYYEWRAGKMADNLMMLLNQYPEHRLLVMLHNLHIKCKGSSETGKLKVTSVRELIEMKLPGISVSFGQFARSGNALHNDLSYFSFNITDPFVIENYQKGTGSMFIEREMIPVNIFAYHHAFEKETIPVWEQYDGCIIHQNVNIPTIIA